MALHPVVRHMLVCDGVRPNTPNALRLDIQGLVHVIRAVPHGQFPAMHPELCVYLLLTGDVGTGRARVDVIEADTGASVFESVEHEIIHPQNRLHVHGIVFRVRGCVFPSPGLYWVEFRHERVTLGREPLLVR